MEEPTEDQGVTNSVFETKPRRCTKHEYYIRYKEKLKADPNRWAIHKNKVKSDYQRDRLDRSQREKDRRRTDPEYAKREREKNRRAKAARLAKDPEGYRKILKDYKDNHRPESHMYSVRKAARKKGVEFDLDLEWFTERWKNGVCELSGLPFIVASRRVPFSASVDRKNPSGPYTKSNCRMIIWWLNMALSNLGEDHALTVFRAVFVKRGEMVQELP